MPDDVRSLCGLEPMYGGQEGTHSRELSSDVHMWDGKCAYMLTANKNKSEKY